MPSVEAVIHDGKMTTIVKDAPASAFVRITGLIEDEREAVFGKPVAARIATISPRREQLSSAGVLYVRTGGPENRPRASKEKQRPFFFGNEISGKRG